MGKIALGSELFLTDLTRFGERGWSFSIVGVDGYRVDLRTDAEGYGLFQYVAGGVRQNQGTCQFSLPVERRRAIAEIKRVWGRR